MSSNNSKDLQCMYPFDGFPSYLEIKIYMGEICRKYPEIATLEIIGITTQMAEIYMIKLQKDPCKARCKDIIFIDGTIHAREWITTSTAMYLINFIVMNSEVLDRANFFIVPCVNVDGYVFSMEKRCFRLWRKNRTLNCSKDCALQGVDLNRNFPIGYAMAGSSDDPGAFNYRGEDPLSEPASQALSFALNKYAKDIRLYISLHAYGNAILFPWSFTKEPVHDCQDMMQAGIVGAQAFLKASGGKRKMRVGNSANVMKSLAAGTSTDYARYVHYIKFSYIFELQGYGPTGFTPKKRHIAPMGYETTMAVFAMARHCQSFFKALSNDGLTGCINADDAASEDKSSRRAKKRKKRGNSKRKKKRCRITYPSVID